MEKVAQRMSLLKTESAFQILARAKALEAQGQSIIHMEIGQPDFKTPQNIIDAAAKAMNDGYTGYSPTPGFPEVRRVIAEDAMRRKGIVTGPEEVVIVPGGKPVMFFTMLMLVDLGDEVIYPNPGFPIYESCIRFAGGKPVAMPLLDKNDFRVDIEGLKGLLTSKTKLIILNNPSNPTGGVLEKEDILAIADILKDYPDVYILSDEIYDQLSFDGQVYSIAAVPGFKDRTIILDGFSKTYAMTGWRLGYGIMPKALAAHMEMLMVNSNSCAASFSQIAAIEAMTGPQEQVIAMREAFKERRNYLVAALNEIPGITCCNPKGAFYVFPRISSFGLSSDEFAERLLTEGGIAAAAGTSFGEYGEGHIRLSYACSMDDLHEAIRRLTAFTKTL